VLARDLWRICFWRGHEIVMGQTTWWREPV